MPLDPNDPRLAGYVPLAPTTPLPEEPGSDCGCSDGGGLCDDEGLIRIQLRQYQGWVQTKYSDQPAASWINLYQIQKGADGRKLEMDYDGIYVRIRYEGDVGWSPIYRPQPGEDGADGDPGAPGKSAFQSWLDQPGNTGKDEAAFVAWLKGPKGDPGEDAVGGGGATHLLVSFASLGGEVPAYEAVGFSGVAADCLLGTDSPLVVARSGLEGANGAGTLNLICLKGEVQGTVLGTLTYDSGSAFATWTRSPGLIANPYAIPAGSSLVLQNADGTPTKFRTFTALFKFPLG
jgi:hypothetical protein